MTHVNRRKLRRIVLAVVLTCSLPASGAAAQWGASRTEAEERARELDHRVVELQHAVRAARYKGDQAELERVETDLKNVQAERVDVLRTLGDLR